MKQMLLMSLVGLMTVSVCIASDDSDGSTMLEMHKKITDGLISFRKEYPDSQPKVYALLDFVNKLFVASKTVVHKNAGVKKLLSDKVAENSSLKQELAQLKGDSVTVKKTFEVTQSDFHKKLEEEHARVERLTQERKELLSKMASLEEMQKEQFAKKKQEAQTAALESAVAKAVASRS